MAKSTGMRVASTRLGIGSVHAKIGVQYREASPSSIPWCASAPPESLGLPRKGCVLKYNRDNVGYIISQ